MSKKKVLTVIFSILLLFILSWFVSGFILDFFHKFLKISFYAFSPMDVFVFKIKVFFIIAVCIIGSIILTVFNQKNEGSFFSILQFSIFLSILLLSSASGIFIYLILNKILLLGVSSVRIPMTIKKLKILEWGLPLPIIMMIILSVKIIITRIKNKGETN